MLAAAQTHLEDEMKVEQVMTENLQTCRPEDSLKTAAQGMWDRDVGVLPVCTDEGRIVGVITDRDICMHACFEGRALDELKVDDAMSRQTYCCMPGDSVERAEQIMRDAQVRRLPVVDEDQRVVGIVSLADLAREAARERSMATQEITEEDVADVLSVIVKPHAQATA
jgi:CBS domain-containing protein